ncbi:MAG: YceI family protein [Bacteroidetes bacterium]|nr:MAG: YceI family protein [Bacteroidota bacterium]
MKFSIKVLMVAALPFFVISCNNEVSKENTPATETPTTAASFDGSQAVDLEASSLYWKGYKIMGNHGGTIALKEGNLQFEKGALTGGKFVVDMKSIKTTDLMDKGEEVSEEKANKDKSRLADHLMDPDFFDVNQFPDASFEITNSTAEGNNFQISGNLTIKGVTNEITFPAVLKDNTFEGTVPVDRTKFGIKYGSGSFFDNLGDRAIKDVFDLEVSLRMI